MNAYVLFGNKVRERLQVEFPKGLRVTEVVRLIADEWKKLNKKEKLVFKHFAKKDKLRYSKELMEISRLGQINNYKN